MVENLRRRLRGETRERPGLTGPREYRPHRVEGRVEWDDVRALTLDEAVRSARRYGHFVAITVVILVVAVWFPGDFPIARQLVPSGGFASPSPGEIDDQTAEVLDRRAKRVGSASIAVGSGTLAGGFDLGGFDDDVPEGGDSGRPGGGEGDDDAASCAVDGQSPRPVAAPTREQALAAQTALEEGIGRPFPVDVVGLTAPLCEAGASGQGVDEVLTLGALVPLDDEVLLAAIEPVIAPWCPPLTDLAVAEALATRSVSPALARGVALCFAAADAAPDAAPGSPAVGPGERDVPRPSVPVAPGGGSPADAPPDPLRPIWQAGSPVG